MEERLSRLERENRLLKRVMAVTLVVIAAFVLMGHVVGERVVEAERFVLVDSSAQPRAVLAVAQSGSGLYLYDDTGKLRAGLVGGTDETGLQVYDQSGKLAWKAP